MALVARYTMHCDADDCPMAYPVITRYEPDDARRDARQLGWTTNGNTDDDEDWHCPQCPRLEETP